MTTTARQMIDDANARVPAVTPQQAHDRLEAGTCVLLDVREPTEWETHITGSIRVPRGTLEFQADPASPRHNPALDPERPIVVFCRSGLRSVLAAATLADLGFADVSNMTGGLLAWKDAGLPTVDEHADI